MNTHTLINNMGTHTFDLHNDSLASDGRAMQEAKAERFRWRKNA